MTRRPINPKTRQWLWFVALWLGGFLTVGMMSLIIKAVMNIGGELFLPFVFAHHELNVIADLVSIGVSDLIFGLLESRCLLLEHRSLDLFQCLIADFSARGGHVGTSLRNYFFAR